MKFPLLTACSVLVLSSVLGAQAFAQTTSAAILGKIFDADGKPVNNASIVVKDTRTGALKTLSSNEAGAFLASNLPVGGPYIVTVNGDKSVTVDSIDLGDTYNLIIDMDGSGIQEVLVVGDNIEMVNVAAGPAATFTSFDLQTAPAFDRDIKDVYAIDPRLNVDNPEDGAALNCAGKHPRFNSITLDGVSQNDRFGLNENGYSTATGMPFPYDAIEQVAVELAPFDVKYGGFSACNINAVTRSGQNDWHGKVFFEWTNDDLRGDSIEVNGKTVNFDSDPYNERIKGLSFGGPLVEDRLFIYAAYEESDEPRFIAQGYDNSGNGEQRDWLSETDFNRIQNIAQSLYGYDAGGQPGNGTQTQEKTLVRLDWNINDRHSASVIYNGYEGVQDRASDSDSNEFEFANHFYQKGAEITSTSVILASQWTDAFSTQIFFNRSEMDDSQITVGDKDFAEVQIRVDGNTVFLGADDSRQANELSTESTFFKLNAQYLAGDHILSAGYEQEKLDIFNLFVQHARGGEIRFNSIDDFEQGTPSRYYYGNAGGSNDANDAAASFSNTLHTVYIQDDFLVDRYNLTITAGLRYDWFTSDDRPLRNSTFEAANGLRNDENIDDLDLLMPRLGLTWDVSKQTTVRGGIGLYSGGNPNVWLSNAWSNDGITNVQRSTNYDGSQTLFSGNPNGLTSIPLSGDGAPGYNPPQNLVDGVTAIDPASGVGSDSFLVLIDPGYEQPSEWKYAIGATHTFDNGVTADIDLLYSVLEDSAIYRDLSESVVGQTTAGKPIYAYTNGRDNFMLTNSSEDADALTLSLVLSKQFDNGLDVTFGYAYTDAEDISPMTSSVAGSNFDNLALHDINNPEAGTSNYEVPHRFTLKLSYGHDFFTGYETRITSYFTRKSGQPQSYVMGSGDLEGDGFFGRHLLYVPSGVNDPNVVFGPDFDTEAFFAWASGQGLQPGFTNRNENYAHWSSRMDVRFDQEIPSFFDDTKGRVYLKVYNFLNLLNDDWGIQYDAQFFSVQAVDSSVNDSGQYVFENFRGGSVTDVLEQASRWEARLGIEFEF